MFRSANLNAEAEASLQASDARRRTMLPSTCLCDRLAPAASEVICNDQIQHVPCIVNTVFAVLTTITGSMVSMVVELVGMDHPVFHSWTEQLTVRAHNRMVCGCNMRVVYNHSNSLVHLMHANVNSHSTDVSRNVQTLTHVHQTKLTTPKPFSLLHYLTVDWICTGARPWTFW